MATNSDCCTQSLAVWCAIINDIISQGSANCRDIEDASPRTVVPHGQVTGWQGRGWRASCSCCMYADAAIRGPLRSMERRFLQMAAVETPPCILAQLMRAVLPAYRPANTQASMVLMVVEQGRYIQPVDCTPANKMNPRSRSRTPTMTGGCTLYGVRVLGAATIHG